MTPTAIINAALTEVGVIEPGNTPPAAVSTFVLEKLNRLLSAWAVQRRLVYVINHQSFAFGASQQSYTIGPASESPDFTATRPVKIERANVVLTDTTPETHIPLEVINMREYAPLAIPALSSNYPTRLYYQPTFPAGTLWPYPYPTDTANELELFMWNQLAQIAAGDVGTEYDLPPGYDNALIYSLAESLAHTYGKPLTPELERDARLARAAIMSRNTQPPRLDLGGQYGETRTGWGRSDFLTGGFRWG